AAAGVGGGGGAEAGGGDEGRGRAPMNGPQPPCIDAGLYWIDEPERVSFQRAGEYLILERGLQFSGDIVGGRCTEDEARSLATLAHAPEKEWSPYAAASDDELLHLLADPAFFVRDIRFVGIQRAYAKSEKTKRLPHKVGLSFDVMSEEAIAHGDHAALQVYRCIGARRTYICHRRSSPMCVVGCGLPMLT
ncbi:MAG: hypothetical protein ACXVCO_15320, partial [Ktedonobacterales bacterium]